MSRLLALALFSAAVVPAFAQASEEAASIKETFHAYPAVISVGDFKLQERSGDYVQARDLLGKIWVAQIFYLGCNECSKNTPTMKKMQEAFRGKADVRLVSVAINSDPLPALREYADLQTAEPDQWLFLTGPEAKVESVIRNAFFDIAMRKREPAPGDIFFHSVRLVLIDPEGVMIGYVDGTKDGAAEALKEQVELQRNRYRMERRIPITGAQLPYFNALLNSSCTILLLLGWIAIRTGYQTLHKIAMLLALAVSMVFLSSYLFYHFVVMEMEPTRFRGEGPIRWVYFSILLSHTILAIAVAPMAIYITVQGLRNALAAHVKVARWTLPIWLYVSVTGVIVYWMLYRMEW